MSEKTGRFIKKNKKGHPIGQKNELTIGEKKYIIKL